MEMPASGKSGDEREHPPVADDQKLVTMLCCQGRSRWKEGHPCLSLARASPLLGIYSHIQVCSCWWVSL